MVGMGMRVHSGDGVRVGMEVRASEDGGDGDEVGMQMGMRARVRMDGGYGCEGEDEGE